MDPQLMSDTLERVRGLPHQERAHTQRMYRRITDAIRAEELVARLRNAAWTRHQRTGRARDWLVALAADDALQGAANRVTECYRSFVEYSLRVLGDELDKQARRYGSPTRAPRSLDDDSGA